MLDKQSIAIKKEIAEITIILDGALSYNDLMNMSDDDIKLFVEVFADIQKKRHGNQK